MFKGFEGVPAYNTENMIVVAICKVDKYYNNLLCIKIRNFVEIFISQHITPITNEEPCNKRK